ncbi:hypothetical protein POTOM_004346 [Populus tomentosa]|uniref:Uncharacterized protein n=1 Tax=Populus tomentosa TaxID=118781 RepID=A0A8X8DF82_POPTO|nr:hypothetical protein POTOM_004346 [Populus tomentosa]
MKERRARGLWGSGHKCKSTRLFIMECEDSEGEELQPIQQPRFLEETDSLSGGSEVNSETTPEISIHALASSPSPKTMHRLLVRVANEDNLCSTWKCVDIPFHMQGHYTHISFLDEWEAVWKGYESKQMGFGITATST